MKNTYKIDFVNNTLTMSKAFEEALNNPASEEYKLFLQLRADFILHKTVGHHIDFVQIKKY